MKRFAWLTLAAALVSVSPAAAQTVGGRYQVSGTNLDGSEYEGTATITVTSDTTCRIHWETGSTTSDGICMLSEDRFAAAYSFNPEEVGLVVYRVKPDGTLDGVWTVADTKGAGKEVLTPAK
ncbi:hypothetical protein [Aurantimonas sp. VKM B-3413]|uniref:hypothetical protein n=1 Tax=Aurantimonas sp. VKM B-3413 TaxID=2779401 RepID=UPI001E59F106|nr:hypothetical protein [Aurantimonas sp. VKM B-3413]MCB8839748.1 hypothetical protein [Aurantimonas sp. VKM B-3413]